MSNSAFAQFTSLTVEIPSLAYHRMLKERLTKHTLVYTHGYTTPSSLSKGRRVPTTPALSRSEVRKAAGRCRVEVTSWEEFALRTLEWPRMQLSLFFLTLHSLNVARPASSRLF